MKTSFLRYLLPALLALTGIGCPPSPPPVEVKPIVEDKAPPPIEDLSQLKGRIEAGLEQVQNRELRTDHAFWTVFHGILGLGLEKTMLTYPDTGKKVNAIDYICNGGEIRGMQFLPTPDGLDVQVGPPGVGQGHQDQFVAEMTQWGMPLDRKFRVAGKDFTFEDFVRHSKNRASVTMNQELTWAIVIISQYYGTNYSWTNSAGEKLTLEDVARYEHDQPIDTAACGGTHRLFGLSWAYHLHLKNGGKTEGVWKDVAVKLENYKQRAHTLQNPDRSFSTDYFKGADRKPDPQLRISTTGHTLEWLALAMTDEELKAPWMQDAANCLVGMILEMGEKSIDGGALYHAAHGLFIYHARLFGTPPAYLALPPKTP